MSVKQSLKLTDESSDAGTTDTIKMEENATKMSKSKCLIYQI